MELLGNTATDLLNPGVKVDVLEDEFGKVNLVGLQEVEEAGEEVEEGLLDVVEGGAEGRPR